MARLLWSIILLAAGCLLAVKGQQRRRERRPVERLLVAETSTRPLFAAREEEQPLVGKGFMPDFGWSGPEWNEGSEWGFRESKRVVTERAEALFEGREYVDPPVAEAREYVEPVRRGRPRWRIEGDGQKAQRRSDIGWRRRPNKASRAQEEVYRRQDGEGNYRLKKQPEEDTYRPRKSGWGRSRVRQEEFAPPSRVEVIRPVGLSRTSVKVTEEQEEYSESQHPGSISLGFFGDIGGRRQTTKPPRSIIQTSERLPDFVPDDLTGLRTKQLRELKEQLESGQGKGFQRAKNIGGSVPGWSPRKPGAQFQPTKEFQPRPLLEKAKIRPQRWRPQTERSLIGSPFFQLEYDDDEDEVKAVKQATESGDWSLTPEHSWSLDQDTERDPDSEGFTPSSADLTSSKELAALPDPVPDTSSKSSSFFLPTLNPFEEHTAAAFRPTEPSVATDDSPNPPADSASSSRPSATKLDLFKSKWDSTSRSPATRMDTQESKWESRGRPVATTQRPDLWTSSYVARARDSERNADRAFHAKKEEKEQDMEGEDEEMQKNTEKSDKDIDDKGETREGEEEEREIVIDREFLEGRRRVSTPSPFLRGPRPGTSRIEDEAESRRSEEQEIFKDEDDELIGELTNLSEENAYSKTHIRKQKTVPRKSTPPPIVVTEDNTELNDENRIQDNLDLPRGVQDNNDRYAKSHIRLMKPKESANRDYSKLTFKDIRAKIPVPKLKKLLSKHGFSVSDIFSKNVKALEIVDRAMRSKSYLKEEDENQISIPWPATTIDLKPERKSEDEKREDSPRRIDWKNERNVEEDGTRRKERKKEKSKPKMATADIDAEIEAEAAKMDLKSLMKKISPMSLSEVLQEVGFTLPDVMAGNREAIKKVLRYHRQVTQPEPIIDNPEDTEEERHLDQDDPFKDLDIEIKMWSPPSVDDVVKVTEEPPVDEASSSTKKSFVPSRKKNGLSSVDLFKKFRKFNKSPRTPSFSTTAKPTTPSGNLFRSTTLMFGDRTTQKTKEKFLPTQFSVKPKSRDNPIVKTRQRVLNRFGFDPREKNEEAMEATENAEDVVTTTPYDASLNITLTNLNMTASDVIDKANLTVPGIDTLFKGITKEKAEVIYGEKKEAPKRKKEARPKRKQTYINTDFGGGGGARFRNSWGGGGSSWGGGGRIVTNRRTSTTTRAPMTYFGLNEPLGESSSTNLDIDNHDLLNGDYEGVVDYDYYPYDYEPSEVPTGVKSALIASSVVGGLAVSIFLCIFMLCLWKQMKNKLRMSMEYEEPRKAGFFASICYQKPQGSSKKETTGYFNKSPASEQHYSTTSSEEY